MNTKLILIRHGSTAWNRDKRYLGRTDIKLDNYGKKQAGALTKKLSNLRVDSLYASDYKRALAFAKIVFPKQRIYTLRELREFDFGIFEGMTYAKIMHRYPDIYRRWIDNPYRNSIPEAESFSNFKKRVIKGLKRILIKNKNKTVGIITHAGPIRIILSHILKIKNLWSINPKLGSAILLSV